MLICSTRLEWLKEEKYRSRDSITKLHDDKELTDEQYEMLSGFLRHVNFIAAEPSKLDVETVVNAYTEGVYKHFICSNVMFIIILH